MPFQIIDEFPPHTAGNTCCACHSSRRPTDRLIDLGFATDTVVDYDGQPAIREGYAILCETCAKEIAHLLGYVTEDVARQMQEMREMIGRLGKENRELTEAWQVVEDVVSTRA